MKSKKLWIAGLISLAVLVFNVQLAFAHTSVTAGDYTIEVGWITEPPIAGQQNAIAVNVSTTSDHQPVEDVSALTVTISYGGESKELILQPLGVDTPGQFIAPILPTIPGQYTISLGGKLGDTAVQADVQPLEVQPVETLQFPAVTDSQSTGWLEWLVWFSILIGLIGIGLGFTAVRNTSKR